MIRPGDFVFLAVAALVFGLLLSWIVSAHPYRVAAFDDWDHIPAAVRWAKELRLTDDSLFLRVPFWHVLLGTFFRIFGPTGLFLLQGGIALGTLALYFVYTAPLRNKLHPALIYLLAGVFLLPLPPAITSLSVARA